MATPSQEVQPVPSDSDDDGWGFLETADVPRPADPLEKELDGSRKKHVLSRPRRERPLAAKARIEPKKRVQARQPSQPKEPISSAEVCPPAPVTRSKTAREAPDGQAQHASEPEEQEAPALEPCSCGDLCDIFRLRQDRLPRAYDAKIKDKPELLALAERLRTHEIVNKPWGREFAGVMTNVLTKASTIMETMQTEELGTDANAWRHAVGMGIPGTWVPYDHPITPDGLGELLHRFQAYQEQILCHLNAHDIATDIPSQIPEIYSLCQADPSAAGWTVAALAELRSRVIAQRATAAGETDQSPTYNPISPDKTARGEAPSSEGEEEEDEQPNLRSGVDLLYPIEVEKPYSEHPLDDYPSRPRLLALPAQPTLVERPKTLDEKNDPPVKLVTVQKENKDPFPTPFVADKAAFTAAVTVPEENEGNEPSCCDHYAEARRLEDDDELLYGTTEVCPHVRAFAVAKMLRRPEDYGLPGTARRVVSHAVHIGVLKKSVLEKRNPTGHEDLRDEWEAGPLYNISTHNRFDELAKLADDFEEVEEHIAAQVITRSSRQSRVPAPKARAAPETSEQVRNVKRKLDEEAERISKASAAAKTPAQRAEDGRRAAMRIRHKIRALAADPKELATYVLMRPMVRYTRELIQDEVDWIRDPQTALEYGALPWLAACVFHKATPDDTLLGLLKCYVETARYVDSAPDTDWVRDLTCDGDVEHNPGPISAPRSMAEVMAAPTRPLWMRDSEADSWCDVDSARAYLEEFNTVMNRDEVGVNDVLCFDYGWFPSGSGDRFDYRTAPYTTQYFPTQINEDVERQDCPGVADRLDDPAVRTPLCVASGSPLRLADPRGLIYYIEYVDEHPGRMVVAANRGLFWKKEKHWSSKSPLDSDGATSTKIFTRRSVRAGSGRVAVLKPFCAVLTPDNKIVGWMVDGEQKEKEWYQPLEDVIPGNIRGKGLIPDSKLRTAFIGYYASPEGSGAEAALRFRRWGPPYTAVSTVPNVGTMLRRTDFFQAFLDAKESARENAIGSRPDVLDTGYLKTYLTQVCRGAQAQPTSMCLAFLKLGLMHRWAAFCNEDPERKTVLAGQTQVHEPNTTVEFDVVVKRLLNASGLCREDCGGTCRPAFPFMRGQQQGRLVFFADPQVPIKHMQIPLHVPWDVLATQDMSMLAAYIMLFAPWPVANLSLLIKTHISGVDPGRLQTFSWYGTTLALPGELRLNVVFPRDSTADLRPGGCTKWSIPIYPTMGPTAVRHYAPYAPIPVVYREEDPIPKLRLVDFCVSWINGISAATIANLASILCSSGLCDGVDRWAVDGLTLFANHSGLMGVGTVDPATTNTIPVRQPENIRDPRDDEVPLLMRCWRDVGDRMLHIPFEADWTDWRPKTDWTLPRPDIRSVGLIILGAYEFVDMTTQTEVHTLLESPFAGAAIFAAAQRRFIAWKEIHSEAGASYEMYQKAVTAREAGSGEKRIYDNVFGIAVFEPGRYLRMVSGAMTAVHQAKPLMVTKDLEATRFLRRPTRWEANTWDLTRVAPMKKVVPGTMPDSVIYTWCRTVPREEMPFVMTACVHGATKGLADITGANEPPPAEYDGPFLEMKHYEKYLQVNDIAKPTTNDVWMNRLMHFTKDYFLGLFHTAAPTRGAPPPGQAPIPLIRRTDLWQRSPGVDMTEIANTYPNVSTTWTTWTDTVEHQVMALLSPHHNMFWADLLRESLGGRAAGLVFQLQAPSSRWYKQLTAEGPAIRDEEGFWLGNGREGAGRPKGRTDSRTASSDTPGHAPRTAPTAGGHQPGGTTGSPDKDEEA